jgi:hypothetical protein
MSPVGTIYYPLSRKPPSNTSVESPKEKVKIKSSVLRGDPDDQQNTARQMRLGFIRVVALPLLPFRPSVSPTPQRSGTPGEL